MKIAALILLQIILLPNTIFTQSNNAKYWNYRETLDSDFLVIGDDQGASIPAAYRNPAINLIKWADATVDLGWYIGVLATEHHLLNHEAAYPGYQDPDHTSDDNIEALFFALKALERLDLHAETAFFLCPGLPSQNGFFIRDDVPAGFHTNFTGMTSVLSDFVSVNIYDKEMSQDQMYHILMGLSLVTKFVDSDTDYNGESIRELARSLATDILGHVAGFSNWTIKNPVCNKIVDRGPDAWSLSYGTNRVIKYITNNTVQYDNDLVVIFNEPVWAGLGNTTNPVHLNSDNTHMIMTLGAVGEVWNDASLNKLMNLATLQDFYLYPLLYGALYDPENISLWETHAENLKNTTLDMLDDAPFSGPASPQPLVGTHSWGSNNRFIRKFEDHINGGNGSTGQQYNGLDYMLLYNLHYILFNCPDAMFEPFAGDTICMLKTDIDLTPYGQPPGGIFSGNGILANYFFNPSVAGPGAHNLVYTVEGDDGCTSSDTISIFVDACTYLNPTQFISDLEVYPNPTSGTVVAEYSLQYRSDIQIKLFDVSGKHIRTYFSGNQPAGSHKLILSNDDLSSGNYNLRFFISGEEVLTKQIIKL